MLLQKDAWSVLYAQEYFLSQCNQLSCIGPDGSKPVTTRVESSKKKLPSRETMEMDFSSTSSENETGSDTDDDDDDDVRYAQQVVEKNVFERDIYNSRRLCQGDSRNVSWLVRCCER